MRHRLKVMFDAIHPEERLQPATWIHCLIRALNRFLKTLAPSVNTWTLGLMAEDEIVIELVGRLTRYSMPEIVS